MNHITKLLSVGRAGRPQYDTHATAIIMTNSTSEVIPATNILIYIFLFFD